MHVSMQKEEEVEQGAKENQNHPSNHCKIDYSDYQHDDIALLIG